jgi:branched-chain amino acid transport system permease protein
MQYVIQNAIDAISVGSLYAVLALGIALIFGIMGLINFAHGELIMVGAYTFYFFGGLPWPVLMLITLAVSTLLALAMDRVAFRPVRGASPATLLVASFALSVFLQNLGLITVGGRPKSVSVPIFFSESFTVRGVEIPRLDIVTITSTVVIVGGLGVFLKKTRLGIQMRAAAEDFVVVRLLGVRANVVIAIAFGMSGFLAGLAALILVAQTATLTPTMGVNPVVIAFVATVIGGLGSLSGAVVGGYALGVATVVLQATLPLEFRVYRDAFVFAAVIVVLLARPQGLLPSKSTVTRV